MYTVEILILLGTGAALTAFIFVGVVLVCCCLKVRRQRREILQLRQQKPPPQGPEGIVRRHHEEIRHQQQQQSPLQGPEDFVVGATKFTFDELMCATDGFAEHNLLGKGGFGFVHKAILASGRTVAVKQLKDESEQGEREFLAEVEVISRVHHKHVVSLIGYCNECHHRLLVFEFVDNKTLHFHLHVEGSTLDWQTRFKIAVGCAKGFEYLHELCDPKIIHRDIKAANILLDSNFEAKVADFGLAKMVPEPDTHVSTRVKGTVGYVCPEYAFGGELCAKSDVYSYGVILLELLTGRRPVYPDDNNESINLVQWATKYLARAVDGIDLDSFIDPRLLKNQYDPAQMNRMVTCAAACTRRMPKNRPRMSQVVRLLEGNHPLDAIKKEIRHGESSSVYVSASAEILEEDARSGEYSA